MGLTPDLMIENFNNLTSWTKGDTGTAVSEISPAGQLRMDTNLGAAGNAEAKITKTIVSAPTKFTMEIRAYFDLIGNFSPAYSDYVSVYFGDAAWYLGIHIGSDGLFIERIGDGVTEVGTNIIVTGGSAAWQTLRFQADRSAGDDAATVETFLEGVSQGTVDSIQESAFPDGLVRLALYGGETNNMVTHVDYVRIATGLGPINDTTRPQLIIS